MYIYEDEKSEIFTEKGQVMFLKIRDHVKEMLSTSGAFRMDKAIGVVTGSSWTMMACVDRLVELKEIEEITDKHVPGQYRIFVSTI